jgi:hypothetical protein
MYHWLNSNLPFSWGLGLQACITIPGLNLVFFQGGPDQLGVDTLWMLKSVFALGTWMKTFGGNLSCICYLIIFGEPFAWLALIQSCIFCLAWAHVQMKPCLYSSGSSLIAIICWPKNLAPMVITYDSENWTDNTNTLRNELLTGWWYLVSTKLSHHFWQSLVSMERKWDPFIWRVEWIRDVLQGALVMTV